MANLPLAFAEVLAGAVLVDAAIKGDSIANVVRGKATPKNPLPGLGLGSSSTGAGGGGATNVTPGTYTNPFPGASASRVDQGVDYTSNQFLAPGRSQILVANTSDPGWRGGGYIAAKLLDGPLAGTVYYVAEGIAPIVTVGETIAAGASLGRPVANPYNGTVGSIEAGWANPSSPGQPLAQGTGGYREGASTAAGVSFNRFIQSLRGPVGHIYQQILGSITGMPFQ
jgi:hypothetical protein